MGPDQGLQVTAWRDATIVNRRMPYFGPGRAMADYRYGSGLLYLSNEGFNYLTGTRVTSVSGKLDKVYVSRVVTPDYISGGPRSVSLTEQRGDLYLTVALDLDNNQAIDNGEYEFVKLDFPG
jgi:hypothetical protein